MYYTPQFFKAASALAMAGMTMPDDKLERMVRKIHRDLDRQSRMTPASHSDPTAYMAVALADAR